MQNDKFIGVSGKKFVRIEYLGSDPAPTKLSDLGEDWTGEGFCPSCKAPVFLTKNRVNKLITCKCGEKLYFEIPKELL